MAAAAPVDAAAEQLAWDEASQTAAFSGEMCLVGLPSVDRQSRHAVPATRPEAMAPA